MTYGILAFFGDDSNYYIVDAARWEQILAVYRSFNDSDPGWASKALEALGWLVCDASPEAHRPDGLPDRVGTLLATYHCQQFVVEPVSGIEGRLLGILTLPRWLQPVFFRQPLPYARTEHFGELLSPLGDQCSQEGFFASVRLERITKHPGVLLLRGVDLHRPGQVAPGAHDPQELLFRGIGPV